MTARDIVQLRLGVDPEAIDRFCRKWKIRELSLFGSALRDDFRPDSDVDLLVVFEEPHRSFGPWMGELQEMEEELASIFGHPVDLVMRDSVERRVPERKADSGTGVRSGEDTNCEVPSHALFPQIAQIVQRYVDEKVDVQSPATKKDLFLAPYYGWLEERLREALRPDASSGEAPEIPRYEASRAPGSTAEVDFWTSRDVREVQKSHVNFVVADTKKWEQQAAYYIDRHDRVSAFVKNAGLGFAIPYFNDNQMHDYQPDFIVKLEAEGSEFLILETKGYDPREDVKAGAAQRWVDAVNAEGSFGRWRYAIAKKVSEITGIIDSV